MLFSLKLICWLIIIIIIIIDYWLLIQSTILVLNCQKELYFGLKVLFFLVQVSKYGTTKIFYSKKLMQLIIFLFSLNKYNFLV